MAAAESVARGVEQVTQHRRRGRLSAGALAEPHEGTAAHAFDEDRVHRAVDRRERVLDRDHRRVRAPRDPRVADALGDAEQFDDVAGAPSELDVNRTDADDALTRDGVADEFGAEGE